MFEIFRRLASVGLLKKWVWKKWYNFMSSFYKGDMLKFMNYGFDHLDKTKIPELKSSDKNNRFEIQLYNHVANLQNIKAKNVLEIGSGRGGGAAYLAQYLAPKSVLGLDLSHTAIAFCKKTYNHIQNLNFIEGDAVSLPFENDKFDVVINVESSHCYPSMEKFAREVWRVLKPGGWLLYCDLRHAEDIEKLVGTFNFSGLKTLTRENITGNIVSALEKMSGKRIEGIKAHVPRFIIKSFANFAGVKGGSIFESLKSGSRQYISLSMVKGEEEVSRQR